MKKNIFLQLFIILCIGCKAQTYPLDTDYKTIPDYAYLKDTNNSYSPYIGEWKANVSNNEITLKIEKVNDRFHDYKTKKFYQDVLFIKYTIKNQQGNIIESTMNLNITDSNIISSTIFPNANLVSFTYKGGQCGVGWGGISLQLIDATHLKWNYEPEPTVITNKNCPDYPSGGIEINLPYEPENIVFTKQ